MKKNVKRIVGAVLCTAMLLCPATMSIAAMPASAATVSASQTQNQYTPYTLSEIRCFQEGKLNFTVKSNVTFNKVNSYYTFKDATGKTLTATGIQVMVYNPNSGWVTPSGDGIKGGYKETANTSSKTVSWCYTDFTNMKHCLIKGRYLKLAIAPVRKQGISTKFATSKYYSNIVYFDYYSKCMVSASVVNG